jgi:hypothetical protein
VHYLNTGAGGYGDGKKPKEHFFRSNFSGFAKSISKQFTLNIFEIHHAEHVRSVPFGKYKTRVLSLKISKRYGEDRNVSSPCFWAIILIYFLDANRDKVQI